MYISSSVHLKESCLKLWYVYIMDCSSQVRCLKLRYVYIIKCSSQGKSFQSCSMYISLSVHLKESSFKVAVSIYNQVFISRKLVLKLRYVYIIKCSSQGESF